MVSQMESLLGLLKGLTQKYQEDVKTVNCLMLQYQK
jgi:hypothetical protein